MKGLTAHLAQQGKGGMASKARITFGLVLLWQSDRIANANNSDCHVMMAGSRDVYQYIMHDDACKAHTSSGASLV